MVEESDLHSHFSGKVVCQPRRGITLVRAPCSLRQVINTEAPFIGEMILLLNV